jgi:hypothetical protein
MEYNMNQANSEATWHLTRDGISIKSNDQDAPTILDVQNFKYQPVSHDWITNDFTIMATQRSTGESHELVFRGLPMNEVPVLARLLQKSE